ncbi:hypothetical protein [Burkholderia singularis]|uniref:Uncharacterized protein n=1 Tax=Burkholderia singularis TaxID=1503053 RepID=A0A238H747_9BURK|nr:hypothetical protein [Burkholderia singularis]SMG01052.1 hypothetical protein BSIN_4038 [Burkholderia singularis]
MTEKTTAPPLIGVAWFNEADYNDLLIIFKGQLQPTFQEWKRGAVNRVKEIERQGFAVVKVNIDPKTFPAWCAARRLEVDARARQIFAMEGAERRRRAPH